MARRPGGVGLGYLPKGGAAAQRAANARAGVKSSAPRRGVPVGVREDVERPAPEPVSAPSLTAPSPAGKCSTRASAAGASPQTVAAAWVGACSGVGALVLELIRWAV